jgi:cytochrome c oxidase cbb3-type subunit 2
MSHAARAAAALVVIGGASLAGFGFLREARPRTHPPGGEAARELITLAKWPVTPSIRRGRVVYEENCIGCHGERGQGDGPAAEYLDPPPRNFQKARFKFRSTGSGQLPFEEDVIRTVTCGLPGSAMPGFPLLAEQRRRDVVDYVLDLAVFDKAKILAEVMIEAGEATPDAIEAALPDLRSKAIAASLGTRKRDVVSAFPEPTAASIERGRVEYTKVCANCHGTGGRGDGFSSRSLRDWQDASIVARDFTSGVFRAGSAPSDLFLRIRTGLNGTPMPGTSEPDAVVWGMVHYIQSLKTPGRIPLTRRMGCAHGE